MLRRQLLTLFALFTGLAALNAPVSAAELQAQVMNAQAQAGGNSAATHQNCECAQRQQIERSKCPKREKRPLRIPRTDGLRPPVVFGSERALE